MQAGWPGLTGRERERVRHRLRTGLGDRHRPHRHSRAGRRPVHGAIREALGDHFSARVADTVRILYGGSVTAENVDSLMAKPDIDGALVGGASLKADSFARIVRARAGHEPD